MKYRVHQYLVYRVAVDIEADSVKEAVEKADASLEIHDVKAEDFAGECTGYLVDELLPDGSVDYDKVTCCEWSGDRLIINGGE